MIKIINQEEFEKCCELMNSTDYESRGLGWGLVQHCIEISENLYVRILWGDVIRDFEFMEYMRMILYFNRYIKSGDFLYNLIYQKRYIHNGQIAKLVINEHTS